MKRAIFHFALLLSFLVPRRQSEKKEEEIIACNYTSGTYNTIQHWHFIIKAVHINFFFSTTTSTTNYAFLPTIQRLAYNGANIADSSANLHL